MAWDMQEEGGGTGPLHFLLLPSPETHSQNFRPFCSHAEKFLGVFHTLS